MRPSHKAWLALGLGISMYELCSPDQETLSEGLDDLASSKLGQLAIIGVGAYITAHLANLLPPQVDAFNALTRCKNYGQTGLEG